MKRSGTHARRKSSRGGFTLVELAVVVTIVGILSVIAVVGYRRYILTSKMGEAQATISAIRIAQEAYKSERGLYANVSSDSPKWCPNATPTGGTKTGWAQSCNGGNETWQTLPVHVDGAVHFAYATWAGTTDFKKGPADWVTWPSTAGTGPWYIVMAKCDLDSDSSTASTELVGSSFANNIVSRNDGN